MYNDTGTALQVCYLDPSNPTVPAPGQTTLTVADGFAQPLRGITNSIQVGVKRSDSSTVAVNVKFVLEGVK